MDILIASENRKKRAELETLLGELGIRVLVPSDVGGLPEVVEDQPTFEGNARKKASSGARASGHWCLADDSGLEVDTLDGRPGVFSARYAGTHGDDRANNAKLVAELSGVPEARRTARFRCALALARPDGEVEIAVAGQVEGRILETPRGAHGFGYDPLFLFADTGQDDARGKTFAELSGPEKASISHRGRALQELVARIPELLRESN